MSSVMLLLFFRPKRSISTSFLRALIAVTLFEAAYVAEVVRGGMQAISPKGQKEWPRRWGRLLAMMDWVILPQALAGHPGHRQYLHRAVHHTSLVIIIGLF